MKNDWLNSVGKSDTVIIKSSSSMSGSPYDIGVVVKVNKMSFSVALKRNTNVVYKFRRDDGSEVTRDIWHSKNIIEATPELWSEIQAYQKRETSHKLLRDIESRISKLPIDEKLFDNIVTHLVEAQKACTDAKERKI